MKAEQVYRGIASNLASHRLRHRQLTAGEGVHRDVQTAMFKVEAQSHRDLVAQISLSLGSVVPLQPRICTEQRKVAVAELAVGAGIEESPSLEQGAAGTVGETARNAEE